MQVTHRSRSALEAHYLIERNLASRLREAGRAERLSLYSRTYDELFRLVPDHPQLIRKVDQSAKEREVQSRICVLKTLLLPHITYLEVGAGDCSVALQVAKYVKQVYALEVSEQIPDRTSIPRNMNLVISDGLSIPVPAGSVHLVYSNQLMEHLHPEDALEQLRGIVQALAPGGRYLCITPNRLCGPHDISRHFDDEATGLHLKEYTIGELVELFMTAGFSRVRVILAYKAIVFPMLLPVEPFRALEWGLTRLPRTLRRTLAGGLLAAKIVATK